MMTGCSSDFFTSADPLLSANNSILNLVTSQHQLHNIQGPPSPPWDENDLDGLDSLVDVKDVDEFLSLSPESLRLEGDADEVISTFLTSEVDFDDLSNSSGSDLSDLISLEDIRNNNEKPHEVKSKPNLIYLSKFTLEKGSLHL